MVPDIEARFWAKVDRRAPDECWPWTRARNEHGYGVIRIGGRNEKAHRVALIQNGEDPGPNVKVLHSCDNPPCCNPRHLRFGSQLENMRDMHERGRRVYEKKPSPAKPSPKEPAGRFSYATHCTKGHEFTAENTPAQAKLEGPERIRAGLHHMQESHQQGAGQASQRS